MPKNRQMKHKRDPIVPSNVSKPSLRSSHYLKKINPLTDQQCALFKAWRSGFDVIVAQGVAGTGKTFLATYLGLSGLLQTTKPFERIVFLRSTVSAREQGFLKGDIDDKEAPYRQVFIDMVGQLLDMKNAWETYEKYGLVSFCSTAYQRGMTYDNTVIIVDECQNMGFEELDMIMTRVGQGSRIIFCGDTAQNDLRYHRQDQSGFSSFAKVIGQMSSCRSIDFGIDDVVRSRIVKDYLMAKHGLHTHQKDPVLPHIEAPDNLIYYPRT